MILFEQSATVYKLLLILFKITAGLKTTNGLKFQITHSLIESKGVRLTWLDCNNRFPTNSGPKQSVHYRSNKFVAIFIVLTLGESYWAILQSIFLGGLGVIAL